MSQPIFRGASLVLALLTLNLEVVADTTFTASSGNWNVGSNWDNGVPSTTDRAIIPANRTCTVTASATCDTISVSGTLVVNTGVALTLRNNVDSDIDGLADNSTINGLVQLDGNYAGGTGAGLIFTTQSHTLNGTGKVVLYKNAAIQITYGLTVTNQLATAGQGIRGEGGKIDGVSGLTGSWGTFRNEGIVACDFEAPGLEFMADTALTDTTGAQWRLDEASTGMKFDRDAKALSGSFIGHCASSFYMTNVSIWTCGTFTRNGAAVDIAGGSAEFRYVGCVDGTPSCGNPCNTCPGSPTCSPFVAYIVSTGASACSCP